MRYNIHRPNEKPEQDTTKMKTTYARATYEICLIIDQCPEDGQWHEIDGHSICIDNDNSADEMRAAIYLPGSSCDGECDLYVTL